jgi:hypothetical protein
MSDDELQSLWGECPDLIMPHLLCEAVTGQQNRPSPQTGSQPLLSVSQIWRACEKEVVVLKGYMYFQNNAATVHESFLFEKRYQWRGGRRRAGEGELDDRANADGSTTGDEIRSDTRILGDAASYQISDYDNSSVNSIRAEKQEDGRTWDGYG